MNNSLLSGIRVLDVTRLLPGPFCTLYFAQMGAEVIKIEEPAGGDYARTMFPEMFAQVNRGKRSVTLDLRQADDVAAFHALVKDADVVIESFRPGVMDKLGCGYQTLKAINPRLVYASLTGYGQTGPYRNRPGHDLNYLAYAGIMDQIGRAGEAPGMANVQIADLAGGALTCAVGILAAVLGARQSGQGTFVDVAMLDGALALQAVGLATLNAQGRMLPRGEDILSGALPNYNVYRCRDGKYVALGALEPKFFQVFLAGVRDIAPKAIRFVLDKAAESLEAKASRRKAKSAPDPRRLRRTTMPVRLALAALFRTRTRDDWERLLADADTCLTPILSLDEVLHNEQIVARGMIEHESGSPAFALPIRFDAPRPALGPSPELGGDNALIARSATGSKIAA